MSEEKEAHTPKNTLASRQKDHRTLGQEDGQTYARDHLFLDDGQRENAAEWHANAKRLRGQEWQAYREGFIKGAEAEESARKERSHANA